MVEEKQEGERILPPPPGKIGLMVAILLLSIINKSNPIVNLQIRYNGCKRTRGLVPGSGFYWQTGRSNLVLSTCNTRVIYFMDQLRHSLQTYCCFMSKFQNLPS